MRLLLDECMSYRAAEQLRAKGHDVVAITELARRQLDDEEQLAYAARERRALVTYNVDDFCELVAEWFQAGRSHHGVLFIKEATIPRHDIGAQVRALVALLVVHPTDDAFCDRVDYVRSVP
jgi:predicted nuclease of predicted toxin-antitoxin system